MKRMLASLALLGCSPPHAEMLGSTASSDGSTSTTTSSTSTSVDATTTGTSTTDDDYMTTFSIMHPPDLGSHAPECDVWSQDCPPDEKCVPWGEDVWNYTKCIPIARDAKEPGEACTFVGPPLDGVDDCVRGAICWDVDPQTNVGECVAMCKGSEANPVCNEPCTSCAINATGVVVICLPGCDPLAQACAQGQACVAVVDTFVCAPDVSGPTGIAGDECEFINVCDPGLVCVNPELVPGCDGPSCCTPFCNMDAADDCDAQLPGSECRPWFEEGEYANTCFPTGTIGFCAVPR